MPCKQPSGDIIGRCQAACHVPYHLIMLDLMRLLVLIDCISKALNVLHQSRTPLKSCSSNKGYVELRTVC